jgi:hypothetical protein
MWRTKGIGPVFFKVGKSIRYPVVAIEQYEKSLIHVVPTPAPTTSLSDNDLAIRWEINIRSLLDLRKAGKLPAHFKIGSSVRYLLAEVEKFESVNSKQ